MQPERPEADREPFASTLNRMDVVRAAQQQAAEDALPPPDWRATIRRRLGVAAVFLFAWVVAIEARLVILQVVEHLDLDPLLFAGRSRGAGGAAIYTDYVIPPYFDSMCAKLTVWNLNWEATLSRGSRALSDMLVYGVKTTIPYYQEILKNPEFRSGRFNTSFVDEHPELIQYTEK